MLVVVIAWPALLLGAEMIAAQEENQPQPTESFKQQSVGLNKRKSIKGYPVRERRIGGPTDVEWDLDNSFPKRDSLLELILRCRKNKHP
jgi:hypothetical protein